MSLSSKLVVLRTHLLDQRILDGARAIAADGEYRVVLAIDERFADQEAAGFTKLVLRRADFERDGLLTDFDDFFWRCGDYPFYAARGAYPDAEFIWQYEYDVVINHERPATLLREIDNASSRDFLVPHLREPEHYWTYQHAMAGRYHRIYRSYFPLVRLSANAIDFLRGKRIADSDAMRAIPPDARPEWPNDEVFAATELINNGFACSDINEVRACYTYETFWSDVLKHPSELPPSDGMIYHAVRTGDAYARLLSDTPWLKPRPSPTRLWSFIADDATHEARSAALQDAVERYVAMQGDDPARLAADHSEIAALLADAHYAADVVEIVIRALASRHMSVTLNWLRWHETVLFGQRHAMLQNLALGMPAWQNSVSEWSGSQDPRIDAGGGNDGSKDVDYGFHTGGESQPFWAVNLMVVRRVQEVRLFNRRDYSHRLAGFTVKVSADAVDWVVVHRNDPDVEPVGMSTDEPIRVRLDVIAQFVRIDLPGPEPLHLREVEIYGTWQ